MRIPVVFVVFGVLAGGGLCGCAGDSRVTVRSQQEQVVDAPVLPTAVYAASDGNTADVYLTDLSGAALDPGSPLDGLSGRITYLHVFIVPEAGSTPISADACSVTVRHVILAEGQVGVYSGGGFLLPKGNVGDAEFGGRVRDATLRLTAQTAGFRDRLGPASLDATVWARRDEAMAKRIGARMEDVMRAAERE